METQIAKSDTKIELAAPGVLPLNDSDLHKAWQRYKILEAWKEAVKGTDKLKLATETFVSACNNGLILRDYQPLAISSRSLFRWDSMLGDSKDYTLLADRRGLWAKGGKPGTHFDPALESLLLQLWLNPRQPSFRTVYDVAKQSYQGEMPSYDSVRRFLRQYEAKHNHIVTACRESAKACKDKCLPYITRDPEILEVGDCLFCDGHTFNFFARHPVTGREFRPTLILWFDWKSRMPVGWEIMPTENTIAISSALRMAIQVLGKVPRMVYLDNGKAFRSKYFNATADFSELAGLYQRLGIGVQFAKPYNARAKPVERFFNTLHFKFERRMPTYCGAGPESRPAYLRRNEKVHELAYSKVKELPSLTDCMKLFTDYVKEYGELEHVEGGISRGQMLVNGRGQGVDMSALDYEFLFTNLVKPIRCGVTVAGIRYESDQLLGLTEQIQVKYSWADMSRVYLYDVEGRKLGEAYPAVAINPLIKGFGDQGDLLALRERQKQISHLKKATDKAAKELTSLNGDAPSAKNDKLLLMPPPEEAEVAALEPTSMSAPEAETILPAPEKWSVTTDQTAAQAAWEAHIAQAEELTRPDFFASQREKYEWLFEAIHKEGSHVTSEDQRFMEAYEQTEEYMADADYFAQKLRVYAMYSHTKQEENLA